MSAMISSKTEPKFKVGDHVTVRDYKTFGEGRCDFTLKITSITSLNCTDGGKLYRYYGDARRGPAGVYEDRIEGRVKEPAGAGPSAETPKTDDDIKATIKSIEIHHEHGWWIAHVPDIGVATQAKTLPELGIKIERIIVAHFATTADYDIDPYLSKMPSSRDNIARLQASLRNALDSWEKCAGTLDTSECAIDHELKQITELRKDLR
jgi:hypothetical protein